MKKSPSKLNVNQEMCWGESKFSLLGIQFSVNLNDIPHINFDIAMTKVKTELKSWKVRLLSLLGRITVLKTLILPKFIHLFSCLPAPLSILVEINTIFYKYLWNGKPDKVKRDTICKDYCEGGLKMINAINFEKAQKLKWLQYNILQRNKVECNILHKDLKNLENITTFGGEWCANYYKILNPFWKAVFSYWADFCASQQIVSNNDISSSAIWFNKHLNTKYIHFSNWSKKGINFVNDIIDNKGNVWPLQILKEKYDLNINFLHYYTVQSLVKKFIVKNKKGNNFEIKTPYIPFHLKAVLKSQQNKKAIYQSLCKGNDTTAWNDIKWNVDLESDVDRTIWKNIYIACFFTIKDNTYIWLQYRFIKRILGTNYYLKKKTPKSPTAIFVEYVMNKVKRLYIFFSNVTKFLTYGQILNIGLNVKPRFI